MTAPLLDESVLESMDFKPACEICKDAEAGWSMFGLHWNSFIYKEHVGHKFTCDVCKKNILAAEKIFLEDGPFDCMHCHEKITKYITEIVKI